MDDTGTWMLCGTYADIDEAYDAAVAEAADTSGAQHPLLSVFPDDMDTSVCDALTAAGGSGTRTLQGAQRAAVGAARSANGVVAVAYSADRFWARRRPQVRIDDPGLELGVDGNIDEPVVLDADDALTDTLTSMLEGDLVLRDGELVDTVELRRLRCRYRIETVKGEGPQSRMYVARCGTTLLGSGRTASEARKAAREAMSGPVGGTERYDVDVYVEVRRESGPHLRLSRVRVAQRGTVRLYLATEKDPQRTKTAGWVFAGPNAPG